MAVGSGRPSFFPVRWGFLHRLVGRRRLDALSQFPVQLLVRPELAAVPLAQGVEFAAGDIVLATIGGERGVLRPVVGRIGEALEERLVDGLYVLPGLGVIAEVRL